MLPRQVILTISETDISILVARQIWNILYFGERDRSGDHNITQTSVYYV
jgi:hypothetical protein